MGEDVLIVAVACVWRIWRGRSLIGMADVLLKAEPVWVAAALAFGCMTLLWSTGWSRVGLMIASISFTLRRWRKGYSGHRIPFEFSVVLLLAASLVALSVSLNRGLSLSAFQSVLLCALLYFFLVDVNRRGKFRYDNLYVKRMGFCLDLRLLLLSFWVTCRAGWERRGKKT